jgi:hypothetical protein
MVPTKSPLPQRSSIGVAGVWAARRQRGAATVLTALLVGLAVMASTFAVVQYVGTSQDQSVTTHAQTQAQMNAWLGAEVVRQYLANLTVTQRDSLLTAVQAGPAAGTALTLSTGSDIILAKLMNSSSASIFVAQITGTTAVGSKAQSKVTLDVRYGVVYKSGLPDPTAALTAGMNTNLSGSVNVKGDTSAQKTFSIDGDLVSSGYSIAGVETLNVTGTANLDSSGAYSTVNSNCDVVFVQGASALIVNARRHICGSGSAHVGTQATANGSINLATTGNGGLSAIGGTVFTDTCAATGTAANAATNTAATCPGPDPARGPGVDMYTSSNNGSATKVTTLANVYIGSGSIDDLWAGGDLYVIGNSNPTISGKVGGNITGTFNRANVATGGGTPSITPVSKVVVPTSTPFNANDYRTSANYAFYVDGAKLKVDVKNVNAVAAGTYLLDNSGQSAIICTTNGNSCAGKNTVMTICTGGNCITHGNAGWYLAGNMEPGVVWFDDDLTVNNGPYYNTFVTTGNVTTSGNHSVYAPNYAGYSGICTTAGGTAIANYPKNFCVNGAFVSSAASGLGNYAYAAGSFTGTYAAASYVGGNMTFAGGSTIYGYVLAGNGVTTAGNVTFYGYLVTQGLKGKQSGNASSLGGSTVIDLTDLPTTLYVPDPDKPGGSGTTVTILSTRYL